jgi:hypothetical protein
MCVLFSFVCLLSRPDQAIYEVMSLKDRVLVCTHRHFLVVNN